MEINPSASERVPAPMWPEIVRALLAILITGAIVMYVGWQIGAAIGSG